MWILSSLSLSLLVFVIFVSSVSVCGRKIKRDVTLKDLYIEHSSLLQLSQKAAPIHFLRKFADLWVCKGSLYRHFRKKKSWRLSSTTEMWFFFGGTKKPWVRNAIKYPLSSTCNFQCDHMGSHNCIMEICFSMYLLSSSWWSSFEVIYLDAPEIKSKNSHLCKREDFWA